MNHPRYQRNLGAITEEEQKRLLQSRVFIAGLGGLGGFLFSNLLRIGIGHITVIDGDCFEENNLNRQLLSSLPSLGRKKAEEAAAFAKKVNPSVHVTALPVFLDENNCRSLIQGHDLVLDALDNIESRRILAASCDALNIPYVYGAIRGWNAQVAVFPPGTAVRRINMLYPPNTALSDKSSLSFTPQFCASLQTAETVKYLLGKPQVLTDRLLLFDLFSQESEELPFC